MRINFAFKLYLPVMLMTLIVVIAAYNMTNVSELIDTQMKKANVQELKLERDVKSIKNTLIDMKAYITQSILDKKYDSTDIRRLQIKYTEVNSVLDKLKESPFFQTKDRKEILENLQARIKGYFYILKNLPNDFKDSYEDGAYSMISLISISKKLEEELIKLKNIAREALNKRAFQIVREKVEFYVAIFAASLFVLYLIIYILDKQILKSLEKLRELNKTFLMFVQKKVDSVKRIDEKYIPNDEIGDVIKDISDNVKHVEKIIKEDRELRKEIVDTQKEIIFTMGAIGESRSKETGNHVKRVAEYSYLLARLYGLSEEEATLIKEASPMHDIGKVAIPDEILKKPKKLTPQEFEIMKTHTVLGYEMLKHSKREILQTAAIIAFEHHEKYNGTGYPRGLKGDDIHIYAAITAIADVFDALGSDRVYKKAWDDEKIINFFIKETGEHFHPVLANLFLANFEEFCKIRSRFKDVFFNREVMV